MESNLIAQTNLETGLTQKYFNTKYILPPYISDNIYDAVISYFESVANGRAAAENLAAAFIDSCTYQGQDIMLTLGYLKAVPEATQTSTILFLLNSVRTGTSLLGVQYKKVSNRYVSRQIIF
jgi:4-aminobutyrate aminotransferase-like enzyme